MDAVEKSFQRRLQKKEAARSRRERDYAAAGDSRERCTKRYKYDNYKQVPKLVSRTGKVQRPSHPTPAEVQIAKEKAKVLLARVQTGSAAGTAAAGTAAAATAAAGGISSWPAASTSSPLQTGSAAGTAAAGEDLLEEVWRDEDEAHEDADSESESESDSEDFGSGIETDAERIRKFICGLKSRRQASWKIIEDIYNFARLNGRAMQDLSEQGMLKGIQTLRKEMEREIPPIYMDTIHVKKIRNYIRRSRLTRLTKLPRHLNDKNSPDNRIEVVRTYITLADLIRFAKKNQKHSNGNVDFTRVEVSVDGVDESDTCSYTLLFISLSFPGCLRPYVWQVVRHLNQLRPSNEVIYGEYIVDELLSSNVKLLRLACDGKERKIAKYLTTCGGYFACDYCEASGNQIPDPDDKEDARDKLGGIHYEAKHQKSNRRTRESVIQQAAAYKALQDEAEQAGKDPKKMKIRHYKGVQGLSPLLRLEYFDFVWEVSYDCFHQNDYGLTKEMLREKFFSKKALERDVWVMQNTVSNCKVPKEWERSTKPIKLERMKTKEFKLLGLYLFLPIVRAVFGTSYRHKNEDTFRPRSQESFLTYVFLYRSLMLPDQELKAIMDKIDLQQLLHTWQWRYEMYHGYHMSTYNMHMFTHALEARLKTGPLWLTSTERYESLYGEAKSNFYKGSISPAKQMISNGLLGDNKRHFCLNEQQMRFSKGATEKKEDSLIFTKDKKFWKIVKLREDNKEAVCREMETADFDTSDVQVDLPWNLVEVHKSMGLKNPTKTINFSDIIGKAIEHDTIIASIRKEWFLRF